ncbi:hypothetical protein BDZ91DRAFT_352579 [Kalaharituber pfeilii]|nr:hypothetical protein BDZ91DRAFT_352579 [Kalaharituber pfeilii]
MNKNKKRKRNRVDSGYVDQLICIGGGGDIRRSRKGDELSTLRLRTEIELGEVVGMYLGGHFFIFAVGKFYHLHITFSSRPSNFPS